jgi:hypothetical protein
MQQQEEAAGRLIINLVVVFAIISVVVAVYLYWVNVSEVTEDFDFVTGKIVHYHDRAGSDAGPYISIKYEYEVAGKVYIRHVYSHRKFPECEVDINGPCGRRRFMVAYSKKNPESSLINLDLEIQNIEDQPLPKKLDGFK